MDNIVIQIFRKSASFSTSIYSFITSLV